jgi:hypothetical protein
MRIRLCRRPGLKVRSKMTATVAAVAVVTLTMLDGGAAAQGQPPADLAGQWSWEESVLVVGPGDILPGAFGVDPEGPVMHLRCLTWGGLTIQQAGSSFSGSADQQWSCVTAGGQIATQAPFPPTFDIAGSTTGRGVHFVADVGQGFTCSYSGSLGVAAGIATAINTTGDCDVPLPFHPNTDKSVFFNAVRQ